MNSCQCHTDTFITMEINKYGSEIYKGMSIKHGNKQQTEVYMSNLIKEMRKNLWIKVWIKGSGEGRSFLSLVSGALEI